MIKELTIYDEKLNELDAFEKVSLVNTLLMGAADAHIDIDRGSDQVTALGKLAQAKRVIQNLEDEFINMAI